MVVRGCGGGVERGRGWYGVNRVGGVGLEEVSGLCIMCGAKEWVLREMDKGKIFGCEGVMEIRWRFGAGWVGVLVVVIASLYVSTCRSKG